jgi:hypothetical protein
MKRFALVVMALLSGASFTAAAKQVELDTRLSAFAQRDADGLAAADAKPRREHRLAQWLNQNDFSNFNNWLNH